MKRSDATIMRIDGIGIRKDRAGSDKANRQRYSISYSGNTDTDPHQGAGTGRGSGTQ